MQKNDELKLFDTFIRGTRWPLETAEEHAPSRDFRLPASAARSTAAGSLSSGRQPPKPDTPGGRAGGSFDVLDLHGLRGIRAGFGGGGGRSAFAVYSPYCRSLIVAISSPSVNWPTGRSGPSLGRPVIERCRHSSISVAAAALEAGSETRRSNFA
jgi:hypothetical protein